MVKLLAVEPKVPLPLRAKIPPLRVLLPLYVFAPDNVVAPELACSKLAVPAKIAETVAALVLLKV
jgi:hypothetical protein